MIAKSAAKPGVEEEDRKLAILALQAWNAATEVNPWVLRKPIPGRRRKPKRERKIPCLKS